MTQNLSGDDWIPNDDPIDLGRVLRVLWRGKWLLLGIGFAAGVIAVVWALMLPNVYRSEALLAPNEKDGSSGLSALAAQYGGVASLAGISLAGGSSDKVTLGVEILQSRKFLADFVEEHDILVPLLAADGWQPDADQLLIDPDKYDIGSGRWVQKFDRPGKTMPSDQDAYEKMISDVLSVRTDQKTGFITISVEHYSPTVAKQWVEWLVADINATVMRHDVEKAEQAIRFLEEQVTATSVAELRGVFYRLIEEQTKTVMLARVSPEYVFRTIDPAVVPELKSGPRRTWIVLAGLVLGGLFGIGVVISRDRIANSRT